MDAVEVSSAEARRIAVRAQLLDGSATSILDTVRRLGFLQIDPISTVAPPQHLVLWSRLGPIESLPLIRARMRVLARGRRYAWERRSHEFLAENAAFKRHLLRELERNG